MKETFAKNSPTLETVQQQFEAWRTSRSKRNQPIPKHLWQAAVELCENYSISQVSRKLRLSYMALKKRVANDQTSRLNFMEIDLKTMAGRWQIECNRVDGASLRISGSGQPPAIRDILGSFLS